jgi:hypothetical protein
MTGSAWQALAWQLIAVVAGLAFFTLVFAFPFDGIGMDKRKFYS